MKTQKFLIGVYKELIYGVKWPSFKKLQQLTFTVTLLTVLLSLTLYGVDSLLMCLINRLFA